MEDDEEEGEGIAQQGIQRPVMDGVVTGMVSNQMLEVVMGLSSKAEEQQSSALGRMRRILQSDGDGDGGGEFLVDYVLASPKCVELKNAIEAGPKARIAVSTLVVLAEVFRHPAGLRERSSSCSSRDGEEGKRSLAVQLRLDKFALWIVQTKLSDVYSHLSSGQRSRENGALCLMSAIVSRGKLIAKQVASKFDFSLEALKKLARNPAKSKQQSSIASSSSSKGDNTLKLPTRAFFIDFALSFLVAGDPGLLRWILQKRVLYAGVLHGLASDDDDTVTRVLSIFKRKVLHASSLVPQGIQVALFGDASLEQLQKITARERPSEAVDVAQEILLAVCTDPRHGICPSGSSWDEFQKSSGQYGGGSGRLLRLMLKLKASELDTHRELLLAIANARPLLAAAYIDAFPYSLEPRTSTTWFSAMSLVSSLVRIANAETPFDRYSGTAPPSTESSVVQSCLRRVLPQAFSRPLVNRALLHDDSMVTHACLKLLLEVLAVLERLLQAIQSRRQGSEFSEDWMKLGTYIQDKARTVLPDGQTLVSVHFSFKSTTGSKRKRDDSHEDGVKKRLKSSSGIAVKLEHKEASLTRLKEIWGEDFAEEEDGTTFLQAKLLDVFRAYLVVLPLALRDINFDPLKFVPEDAKCLSSSQQHSLVALLLSARRSGALGDGLYTSFKLLTRLVVSLKTVELRQKAHVLLDEALLSTGAFENNPYEISVWLHNLPGWPNGSLDETIATFLCDLVLNVGRNLYKYMDQLHSLLTKGTGDEFGPLVVCSLDAFVRLARPEAKSLKIPQKAAISAYLANVLDLLLHSQVYPRSLAMVITSMLSSNCDPNACEWTALKLLLRSLAATFVSGRKKSVCRRETCSFSKLQDLLETCREDESTPSAVKAFAFARSLYCVHPTELIANFHQLLEVFNATFAGDFTVLMSLIGAYPEVLSEVPDLFSADPSSMETDGHQVHLLSSLLRQCSFTVLFRAACYNHGKFLNVPLMESMLLEAISRLSDADVIISIRMLLHSINDEYARGSRQYDAHFKLLGAMVALSQRLQPGDMEQLAKDVFSHPVISVQFLSKETQIQEQLQWKICPSAGHDELKQMMGTFMKSLHPLNYHVLLLLELLLSHSGDSLRSYCEVLTQRATETFIAELEESLSEGKQVVPSASLLFISTLAPYLNRDLFVRLMDAVLSKVVSKTTSGEKSSLPEMVSYQQVAFYLSSTGFQKCQDSSEDRRWYESHGDLLAQIFNATLELAMVSSLEIASSCLLMAMKVLLPTKLLAAIVPVEVLHCSMRNASRVKAEIVTHLVRENPVMMVEFGRRVAGLSLETAEQGSNVSESDLLQLLPAARHFLENSRSFKGCSEDIGIQFSKVYGDLLAKRFIDWDTTSGVWDQGEEHYEKSFLATSVSVLDLAADIRPLQAKQKSRILRSLLHDTTVLDTASSFPSLTNRLVAKASLVRILLLQHEQGDESSTSEALTFISVSLSTMAMVYKQFDGKQGEDSRSLVFLEERLLGACSDAVERLLAASPGLVYKSIKKMAKTLLRFRFGKIEAMRALQRVFVKLLEMFKAEDGAQIRKLVTDVMDFVTGHSQFVQALLAKSKARGTALTEIPSILSLFNDRGSEGEVPIAVSEEEARFHIVRLLRVLYAFRVRHREHFSVGEASRQTSMELESLLLVAYGATLSTLDQEIFCLMHEIETSEGDGFSGMSEMDYLWGDAALERRRDKTESGGEDLVQESLEEMRKRRFKEDLALNLRMCGLTALHFPMKRDMWTPETVQVFDDSRQEENAEVYDPAFILPFAMHALSVGCIDAEEFVRSGFLAIAFASMSSSLEAMRKYGYELLVAFSTHLEVQSFKGKSQINTLLVFMKNAISQPWQRIPSVISLFAAEASCILLHPESPNYVVVNRFILRSPSIDLQAIPLFQTMFTSGSTNSRGERNWIVKLLIAGLVSSADALIYRRQFVAEILMSFCTSAMADISAQQWTLKVLRRAAAISSFVKSLINNTGLLSWLASLAITSLSAPSINSEDGDAKSSFQVIELLLSSRGIETLLLAEGTEELSKVASMLLHFVSTVTPTSWDVCGKPLFRIVNTALRLSQRRNKYQSAFNLSWRCLHDIAQSVQAEPFLSDRETRLGALECLLRCPPPEAREAQDHESFCSITRWATSELNGTESIAPVFFRWCSSAVILGSVPENERRGFTSWWSLFTYLNAKRACLPSFEPMLPRLLLSVSYDGDAGMAGLVNVLLVVLSRLSSLSREREDDANQRWIPDEMYNELKVVLSELPCPEELHPLWRWGYHRAWSSKEHDGEVYRAVLTLLQRFYASPARQISQLEASWKI
ncbi:uncharacterized protein LOC9637781 [Selaginella moellendorffii]|uniref:uncharacterized protein LOC9637781 n=1 Tax=Selaginella moellendorffii TaxID=88036 RepID=UPI000D1CB3D1|nr:uncharacterized protein LOC9637781 [Selaginella moellendorffii]|eukprot:XP_024533954.1 uncharacterized protein LOC9637781 [Selaginella moellendorffii]